MSNDDIKAYHAVSTHLGFLDRSECVRLDVLGPDRVRFLHNLTTNDVKRLAAGQGQEAFVTSPVGKTLALVTLLACDDRILVRTGPAGLSVALPHLQKYGIFDDVMLNDASGQTFEYHLAGPKAEEILRLFGIEPPAEGELSHRADTLAEVPVRIVREAPDRPARPDTPRRDRRRCAGRRGVARARRAARDGRRPSGDVRGAPDRGGHSGLRPRCDVGQPAAGGGSQRPRPQLRQGVLPGAGDGCAG